MGEILASEEVGNERTLITGRECMQRDKTSYCESEGRTLLQSCGDVDGERVDPDDEQIDAFRSVLFPVSVPCAVCARP